MKLRITSRRLWHGSTSVAMLLGLMLGPASSQLSSVLVDGEDDLRPLIDLQSDTSDIAPPPVSVVPKSQSPTTSMAQPNLNISKSAPKTALLSEAARSEELPAPEPISAPKPVRDAERGPSNRPARSSKGSAGNRTAGNRTAGNRGEDERDFTLGVSMRAGTEGVRLEGVIVGSPAAAAGLRPGDEIVAIREQAVATPEAVTNMIESANQGVLPITIRRGDRRGRVQVQLAAKESSRPSNAAMRRPVETMRGRLGSRFFVRRAASSNPQRVTRSQYQPLVQFDNSQRALSARPQAAQSRPMSAQPVATPNRQGAIVYRIQPASPYAQRAVNNGQFPAASPVTPSTPAIGQGRIGRGIGSFLGRLGIYW